MRADTLTPRDLAKRHAERRDPSSSSSFRRETFVLRAIRRVLRRGVFSNVFRAQPT